jgi:hypothetical protein
VRFHDGQQATLIINEDTKLQALHNYVNKIAPMQSGRFTLMAGYPPKAVTNLAQTFKQAGIQGGNVNQ